MTKAAASSICVIDFETTGLSPALGDRVIEIGAVIIEDGRPGPRYQALANPGFAVSAFIESYTGITNAMLANARPVEDVMRELAVFIGDRSVVAHNAAFDRRFLASELDRIGGYAPARFACSMLISRRLYPDAPNHRLGTLVRYRDIEHSGTFHRALADSEMTARLWLDMLDELETRHALHEPTFEFMQALSRQPKSSAFRFVERHVASARCVSAEVENE